MNITKSGIFVIPLTIIEMGNSDINNVLNTYTLNVSRCDHKVRLYKDHRSVMSFIHSNHSLQVSHLLGAFKTLRRDMYERSQ